jgi:hypothetical protein
MVLVGVCFLAPAAQVLHLRRRSRANLVVPRAGQSALAKSLVVDKDTSRPKSDIYSGSRLILSYQQSSSLSNKMFMECHVLRRGSGLPLSLDRTTYTRESETLTYLPTRDPLLPFGLGGYRMHGPQGRSTAPLSSDKESRNGIPPSGTAEGVSGQLVACHEALLGLIWARVVSGAPVWNSIGTKQCSFYLPPLRVFLRFLRLP